MTIKTQLQQQQHHKRQYHGATATTAKQLWSPAAIKNNTRPGSADLIFSIFAVVSVWKIKTVRAVTCMQRQCRSVTCQLSGRKLL